MDGTLYDLKDLVEHGFNVTIEYLTTYKGMSKEQATKFLNDNSIYPYIIKDAKSTTHLFMSLGYDIKHWDEYRSNLQDTSLIKKENAIQKETLEELKKLAPCVLLTNNTPQNVHATLNRIGLKEEDFSSIYTNDQDHKNLSKTNAMAKIIKTYNAKAEDTLSIGDRYLVDVKPILELKGKGIVIPRPSSFKKVIEDFNNFKTCDEYEYFD